jgi:hypothetical protein
MDTKVPPYSRYPGKMVRRQHTPQEIERVALRYGFRVKHVVYWHAHPYPPSYEKKFPRVYNRIAYLMNPLGETSLGAWMCSSFVAVLERFK